MVSKSAANLIVIAFFGLGLLVVMGALLEPKEPIMTIYEDKLTGCQYLEGYREGLTPRLDENGKPICGLPSNVRTCVRN